MSVIIAFELQKLRSVQVGFAFPGGKEGLRNLMNLKGKSKYFIYWLSVCNLMGG